MSLVHVVKSTSNPSAAPAHVGQHWINTALNRHWLANGTASVANWIEFTAEVDTGITQLTGDVTAGPGSGSQAATIAANAVTNAKVAAGIDAVKIADGSVTNSEFQFINTLTGNVQTQIDGKVAKAGDTMSGDLIVGGNITLSASSGNGDFAGDLHVGGQFKDGSTTVSLDTNARTVYNGSGNGALSWGNNGYLEAPLTIRDGGAIDAINIVNRTLHDGGSAVSADWSDRGLYRSGGQKTVDWESSYINDSGGEITLDANNRHLFANSGGTDRISWGDDGNYLRDGSGNNSIEWGDRIATGTYSRIDWGTTVNNNITITANDPGNSVQTDVNIFASGEDNSSISLTANNALNLTAGGNGGSPLTISGYNAVNIDSDFEILAQVNGTGKMKLNDGVARFEVANYVIELSDSAGTMAFSANSNGLMTLDDSGGWSFGGPSGNFGMSYDGNMTFNVGAIGFLGAVASSQQISGANLTNSVTAGGTDNIIANYSSLTIYATDAAAIRNNIYQLARKLKQVNDALRVYGLLN